MGRILNTINNLNEGKVSLDVYTVMTRMTFWHSQLPIAGRGRGLTHSNNCHIQEGARDVPSPIFV